MVKREAKKRQDAAATDAVRPAFAKGDTIVHPSYGAGTVVSIQKQKIAGVEREYYHIELVNDHGILMMPIDQAEAAGLRHAIGEPGRFEQVLAQHPEHLDADHRKRQAELAERIHSGDAFQVAEAIRDLAWREQQEGLTERDSRLKAEAETLLAGEMALMPEVDLETASQHLSSMISSAIEKHLEESEEDEEKLT
jgi:CarD family transcriptional regulator